MNRKLQVNEVAKVTGVSVRTLHHYDAIGLLVPRARSASGYRLYDDDDLLRLQQILVGRELGLPLEEIRRSLDDPGFDRRRALVAQRRQLEERSQQTARMIGAIDAALALLGAKDDEKEETMTTKLESMFDGFDAKAYEAEAEARWGNTRAYEESNARAKRYTEDDWKQIRAEQAAIYADAARLMEGGAPPSSEEAMDVAERHRLSIDRWFYPCAPEIHRGLADMWESDPRYSANIDKVAVGLTAFLAEAVRASARRAGARA
jgi:DNA-binding transcriptional MerR regulator